MRDLPQLQEPNLQGVQIRGDVGEDCARKARQKVVPLDRAYVLRAVVATARGVLYFPFDICSFEKGALEISQSSEFLPHAMPVLSILKRNTYLPART